MLTTLSCTGLTPMSSPPPSFLSFPMFSSALLLLFSTFWFGTLIWLSQREAKPSPPPSSPHTPDADAPFNAYTLTTPPNKSQPPQPETLDEPKGPVDLSTLDTGWKTITDYLHKIPQVELDYFINFVLPRADIANLDEVAKVFEGSARACFPEDPKDAKGVGNDVFKPMQLLFEKAAGAVKSKNAKLQPNSYYYSTPSTKPKAAAHSSSIPDVCLIRNRGKYEWEDLALTFEVKKNAISKDIDDNRKKIIWNKHQTLRTDPCRRFAFGITIENTDMQLWLMARGVVVASSRFDFFENEPKLFEVLASFLFATHTSLGWDPNVQREGKSYKIKHDGQEYHNCTIIHALGAELGVGRCTRVFRAEDRDGIERVIRDLWSDSDRKSEVDILQDIERRSGCTEDQKRHFLWTLGNGTVHIDSKPDTVLECVLHGERVPQPYNYLRVLESSDSTEFCSQGSLHSSSGEGIVRYAVRRPERQPYQPYAPQYKKHERYVVAERGETVDKLDSFEMLFTALLGALSCLEVVFSADYVHRDVSTRNILLINGRGVLVDFEYAKDVKNTSKHEIRTGTEEYMAVEVFAQKYRFLSQELSFELTEGDLGPPPFRHNALHDLESLWWVAVWFMFSAEFVTDSKQYERSDERLEAQKEAKKELFGDRTSLLSSYPILVKPLDPRVRKIASGLFGLFMKMMAWYAGMEKTLETISTFRISAGQIKDVRDCFEWLRDMSHGLPSVRASEVLKKEVAE